MVGFVWTRTGLEESMVQALASPAWASTAVGPVVAGPSRTGTVIASGDVASYVSVPELACDASLLALLRPAAIRLPLGMCVPNGQLPEIGTEVQVGHGIVSTPGGTWRPVRWWDPRPHVDPGALARHGHTLLDVVSAEPASAFGLRVPDALRVAAALAGGDPEPALSVIGLGPGLTPAGDDVVAGAFAVLALLGRLDDSVRDAIHAHARTRTVALSAALLVAAGRGQMIPQAARMVTILAAGEPYERVSAAAGELFRVGSTSGHDLCLGMAGALANLS
jgi:hypothetical protein